MNQQTISYQELYQFVLSIFLTIGCSPNDAALATRVLLSADLRGIDSHGVARLSGYVRLWKAGRISNAPNMIIEHETPSTATVNADKALGLVSAPYAMEIAINKAKNVGTGWVSVNNSNHFGIAGYHAMMALEYDMIGIAMTNASALVAPTFSIERMLGTNPIAVAIPAGNQLPIVVDMATTTAANGKLEILQRLGKDTPLGWSQTANGNATTDAHSLKNGGALLPLGSDREHGSHKGYALGAVVDILSAVLSGASYGPWAPPFPAYVPMPQDMPGQGLGHFFGAMRVDAFRKKEEFMAHIDNWIQRFRSAQAIDEQQPVLIPGDPERMAETIRMKQGIPLNATVVEDLIALSQNISVKNPF